MMIDENSKYTIKGKCTIVSDNENLHVLKEKGSLNIKGLFTYLKSRNFFNFPEIIDDSRGEYNVYEYIRDIDIPPEQKADDLISLVSNLHLKTLYFKEVREDKFKEIYDSILSNINFLEKYYSDMFSRFFKSKYMSPSEYIFMQNYYKLEGALVFCGGELDKWYENVKFEKKMRVSVVHSNLSIDHYLKSDKDAIISWENHKVDTPVLDLVNLYKNDKFKYGFSTVFESYLDRFSLNISEKKLFFILITLPEKLKFNENEFKNSMNARKFFDSLFKTEELIKPYYSENEEKEQEDFTY